MTCDVDRSCGSDGAGLVGGSTDVAAGLRPSHTVEADHAITVDDLSVGGEVLIVSSTVYTGMHQCLIDGDIDVNEVSNAWTHLKQANPRTHP